MKKQIFSIVMSCFLLLPGVVAYAQGAGELAVSGTVTDKSKEPIPGVLVRVEGKNIYVVTDFEGKYSLTTEKGEKLNFSLMGFTPQTVVADNSVHNIVLGEDAVMLEETVVVGYGVQKSKDLTAPITVMKGAELSKLTTSNAAQALQGKVAGVQIVNSGAPGAGAAVKIRGVGSIGDYASPLYVVDGTFVENIDFLGANDIETMSVLKDASASAIYGVRAANGVVLITTKKGSGGKPVISYDGYAAIQVPVNIMKLTNTAQYIELRNRADENIFGSEKLYVDDYPANTDWYKELTRNAFMQSHNIDVSGLSEGGTNYSIGVNYFSQDGIMNVDNGYDRYNLRGRFEQKVTPWLKVGATTIVSTYNKQIANEEALKQAYVNPPLYPVYDDGNQKAYPDKFAGAQQIEYGAYGNSYSNPVALAYYKDNKEKGKKIMYSVFADFSIVEDKLSFKTSYNQDYNSLERKDYTPEHFVEGSQGIKQSTLTKTFENKTMQILDNVLTYNDHKDVHSYTVLLGQSTRMERMSSLWGSAVGVPGIDEQSKYLKTGSYKDRNTDDDGTAYNGLSAFARGTYNYDSKYLLSATFRADASSKYQEKWGFFPSVGLGWVLSEEEFLKGQKVVEYLKFRASWGMLGNDNIPANSAVTLGASGLGSSAVLGNSNDVADGMGAQTVLQNRLKWEVVNEYNVGFDAAFLKRRLTAEADFYYRITDNVVFSAPIASGGGTKELLSNNGKVLNTGVELTVGWADKLNDKFSYHVGINATTVHNEVLALNGQTHIPGGKVRGGFATRTAVGHPIGAFYGYEVIGVYQTEKEAVLDPVGQPVRSAGYFRYKDNNGDKVIDDKDKTYLGSPIPWLMGGIDFGFNYGDFDFGLTLQGQLGNKILNAKRMNRDVFATGNYDLDFYENAWNGSGSSNTYPSPEAYNHGSVQQTNSFFVEDGSYLRIQNVQLGYTIKTIKIIPSLRVYVSAQRPLTLFGYNGFTPEISGSPIAMGIDDNVYPMQAIYSVGLKVNF